MTYASPPDGRRTIRFTVSLPDRLMRTLDRVRAGRRYANRSEFIRDLLRAELVKEEWAGRRGETVGVLLLVYDHDTRALADKLTDIQHHRYRSITAALHIHLDQHACLEVIALRGHRAHASGRSPTSSSPSRGCATVSWCRPPGASASPDPARSIRSIIRVEFFLRWTPSGERASCGAWPRVPGRERRPWWPRG